MIWSREIEGGSFATPERRAALEARIGELSNGIRDEVVRRYYRQDLAERLQRTFAPKAAVAVTAGQFPRGRRGESPRRFAPRSGSRGAGGFAPRRPRAGVGRLRDRRRPLPGGERPARDQPDHARPAQRHVPPRGADLAIPINHPWLLHDHLEEVAMLELAHPEATKLRAGIITAFARPSPFP